MVHPKSSSGWCSTSARSASAASQASRGGWARRRVGEGCATVAAWSQLHGAAHGLLVGQQRAPSCRRSSNHSCPRCSEPARARQAAGGSSMQHHAAKQRAGKQQSSRRGGSKPQAARTRQRQLLHPALLAGCGPQVDALRHAQPVHELLHHVGAAGVLRQGRRGRCSRHRVEWVGGRKGGGRRQRPQLRGLAGEASAACQAATATSLQPAAAAEGTHAEAHAAAALDCAQRGQPSPAQPQNATQGPGGAPACAGPHGRCQCAASAPQASPCASASAARLWRQVR